MLRTVILQLARRVSQKQSDRSQKARLVHLETFPELWTLTDSVFVSVLSGGSTCHVLQPEWHFHHGVSCAKVLGPTNVWGPVTMPKSIRQDMSVLLSREVMRVRGFPEILGSLGKIWMYLCGLNKNGLHRLIFECSFSVVTV
jgi:hypothetical protein